MSIFGSCRTITGKLSLPVLLLVLVLGCVADVHLVSPTRAESTGLQLEVLPETVKVSSVRQTRALVVVRNPTTNVLSNLRLSWFTDAEVQLLTNEPAINSLGPQSQHAWELVFSLPPAQFKPGTVYFRVDYSIGGNGPLGVAVASMQVVSGALEDADKIADVRIETTLESLNQQNPGKVYLVITNKTDTPLKATVKPVWPDFIMADDESRQVYSLDLAPHYTDSIEIGVRAKERVRPGKHLLLFDVMLVELGSGQQVARHKIVTRPVNVGVFGESQILTLLGVPSFLLLPGFLVLAMVKMTWKWRRFRVSGQADTFPWDVKSAEFALAAITISMVVTAAYSWLWSNLLSGYGLQDVIVVWFISIFIGFVGYVGGITFLRWRRRRLTPSTSDQPIALLEKLGRRKQGIYLNRGEFSIKSNNAEKQQRAILLDPIEGLGETIWVAPYITLRWTNHTKPALKKQILKELEPPGPRNAARLAELLKNGSVGTDGGRVQVTANWKPIESLSRPAELKKSDFKKFLGETRIVDVEEE